MDILQIIGYLGSVLIAVSLMMNNIIRLRWINLFGASTFAIYGFFIQAYPVLILNGFITCVDIFYLVQIKSKNDYFDLQFVDADQSPFLNKFLSYNRQEIIKFFPDFNLSSLNNPRCVFILRNLMPVGLFVCVPKNKMLEIKLDFVIKEYRDFKNAHYLFQHRLYLFKEQGFKAFITKTKIDKHQKYLIKLGFTKRVIENENFYYKEIN